jgi:hypothetical protein
MKKRKETGGRRRRRRRRRTRRRKNKLDNDMTTPRGPRPDAQYRVPSSQKKKHQKQGVQNLQINELMTLKIDFFDGDTLTSSDLSTWHLMASFINR